MKRVRIFGTTGKCERQFQKKTSDKKMEQKKKQMKTHKIKDTDRYKMIIDTSGLNKIEKKILFLNVIFLHLLYKNCFFSHKEFKRKTMDTQINFNWRLD